MLSSCSVSVDMHEEHPLAPVPGTADEDAQTHDEENDGSEEIVASFRNNKFYRQLAICSIICGCSCIGCTALIYSVKAEHAKKKETAKELSQKAKKFSIISIVTWLSILALIPTLMALVSYILTLMD